MMLIREINTVRISIGNLIKNGGAYFDESVRAREFSIQQIYKVVGHNYDIYS